MNAILYWITGKLPCRIIDHKGRSYLERYYLFTLLGVRFYIHRFVGSDPAGALHDHPWPWAGSVVLNGWYYEELRGGSSFKLRRVRWFNWLTGDTFHRIILPVKDWKEFSPCWTLFFHRAAYTKPWGFLRPIENETPMLWWPHNYPNGDGTGTPGAWWLTVPKGRNEPRRMPA